MSVVFYVSGHGFGHASRQVEVINALGRRRPGMPMSVRSAVSANLLARTVSAAYALTPVACDPGIVQRDSITHDDPATRQAAEAFYAGFDARVADEARALAGTGVRLIVGDIPPLAFAVAARLGVPSVAIANFTWDWIYETQDGFEDARWIVDVARRAYASATLALELPFSGGFEVFPRRRAIPLIARHATHARAETREAFGLPPDRRLALLSFGGYGLPSLDLPALDCFDDWTIVTTDRVTTDAAALPHVVRIAEARFRESAYRYEDLVAAVDAVVTKPGYGIIAECVTTGTAMLYTSRGRFREYDVLVGALPRYVRSRFLPREDLLAGRWRVALEALMAAPPPPERLDASGAEVAAATIEDLLD